MKKLVLNKLTYLSVIVLTIFSCANKNADWTGNGKIDTTGQFKTNSKFVITVENINNIVSFSIRNPNNQIVFESTNEISNIHKWFLYWDDNNKALWVYSSDIGSSVCFIKDQIFQETTITYENQNRLQLKIPAEIEKDILE